MKKFWLVFRYEYLRHVLRKRFLFALMSIPLFILLMIVQPGDASATYRNYAPLILINADLLLRHERMCADLGGVFANGHCTDDFGRIVPGYILQPPQP